MSNKYVKLSRAQEQKLFELCRSGNRGARNFLITNNIGLAYNIAYMMKSAFHFVELDDLKAYAIEGLIISIDAYDYTLGNKFSSYGCMSIRNHIIYKVETNECFIRYPRGYIAKNVYGKSSVLTDAEKETLKQNVFGSVSIDSQKDDTDYSFSDRMVSPEEYESDYSHNLSDSQKSIERFIKSVCTEKHFEIFMKFYAGTMQVDIADEYGVTRQHIGLIVKKVQTALKPKYNKFAKCA